MMHIFCVEKSMKGGALLNVREAIVNRRSIRKFKEDPIPDELLFEILETARWSPSPGNSQPWRFIIIKDRLTLRKIVAYAKYGVHLIDAPMAIAVVATPIEAFAWYNEIEENRYAGAVASTTLMLAAWERGVGTCWVSVDRKKVGEILGLPARHEVVSIIPIGFPEKIEPHRENDRNPAYLMIYSEKFGERFPRIDQKK